MSTRSPASGSKLSGRACRREWTGLKVGLDDRRWLQSVGERHQRHLPPARVDQTEGGTESQVDALLNENRKPISDGLRVSGSRSTARERLLGSRPWGRGLRGRGAARPRARGSQRSAALCLLAASPPIEE